MSEQKIAKRYAKGLYSAAATSEKSIIDIGEQLQSVAEIFKDSRIKKLVNSAATPSNLKEKVLITALEQINHEKTLKDFFKILSQAGRAKLVPLISATYQQILREKSGILRAELISAAKLQPKHLEAIESFLSTKFDAKVELSHRIDPKIMGGFIIKVGNRIVDLSLKSKLESLTQAAIGE